MDRVWWGEYHQAFCALLGEFLEVHQFKFDNPRLKKLKNIRLPDVNFKSKSVPVVFMAKDHLNCVHYIFSLSKHKKQWKYRLRDSKNIGFQLYKLFRAHLLHKLWACADLVFESSAGSPTAASLEDKHFFKALGHNLEFCRKFFSKSQWFCSTLSKWRQAVYSLRYILLL